ncbi:hypothetical protein KQX54_021674 [Cotesia glomerata]|uniref:Uncharacterized protein n=1 Tax=Cotesia glomerata TaxID=32391 RepID=A0AAV7J795_COTGL|nr:hypothetical protein KQX54_021674 [Cotesia glomerata]
MFQHPIQLKSVMKKLNYETRSDEEQVEVSCVTDKKRRGTKSRGETMRLWNFLIGFLKVAGWTQVSRFVIVVGSTKYVPDSWVTGATEEDVLEVDDKSKRYKGATSGGGGERTRLWYCAVTENAGFCSPSSI